MIKVEIKDGESAFSGEGKGIELVADCMALVSTLSKHLASQNEHLADLYEYLVTKNAKEGTLFEHGSASKPSKDIIFCGTIEEFLKEGSGDEENHSMDSEN